MSTGVTQAQKDAATANGHAAVDALAALVVVDAGPGPGPDPEPGPQDPDLLPLQGSASNSLQLNLGRADWIRMKDLPAAPVPWTGQTTAPSQNGVRPADWISLWPWGADLHLYSQLPRKKNGRLEQAYLNHSSDVVWWQGQMAADPPPVGARGTAFVHPITTWHGHPAAGGPLYHGIQANADFKALMPNGTSELVFNVPGLKGPTDFSYAADGKRLLFTSTEEGRIVNTVKNDDGTWSHSTLATGCGRSTGIRWTPFGTFVCDNAGDRILKVGDDGKVTVLMAFTKPFAIDYFDNKLVILDSVTTGIFIVDPVNPVAGANLMPAARRAPLAYGTVWVDKNGTIGPKNSIYWSRSQGQQNGNETFALIANGFTTWPFNTTSTNPGGWTTWGNLAFTFELYHYPWLLEGHPIFGILLCQGTGNLFPRLVRPRLPTDPVEEPYDNEMFKFGLQIYRTGVFTATVGSVPSWSCQFNPSGWSLLNISTDWLADMLGPIADYSKLAAWIQDGGFGSFKRPDIVGYGLKAFGYWLLRSSQRYACRDGGKLITDWWAWCDVHSPGPVVPMTQAPQPPDYNSFYLQVEKVAAGFKVSYYNKDFNTAPIPATSIRVVDAEGMPFESQLGTVTGPDWLLPASLSAAPHSLTCRVGVGSSLYTKAVQA